MDNAARIKALRKRLGMNQEAVADGSGGRIDRTMMSKLESGRNKGSTLRVHEGLAVAMGFRSDQMSAYLGGTLGLDELLAGRTSSPTNELRATPATVPVPVPTDDDGSPLERALNAALPALAGSDELFSAVCADEGVVRVEEPEDLLPVARAVVGSPAPGWLQGRS